MNAPIEFKLDQTSSWRGLYFEQNGQPVSVERALTEGFFVSKDDANCIATLVAQFITAKEQHAR